MSENPASAVDDARRDAVRAFLEAHKDEFVAQLSDWIRIPSVWTDPERRGDVERSAEWFADAARADRISDRRDLAGQRWCADGVRGMAQRQPERAHRRGLRPPRCATRRSDRVVELRAVRAGGRSRAGRRSVARSRSVRRQGDGALPPARVAGESRGERAYQPAGASEVAHRGRGGVRLAGVP